MKSVSVCTHCMICLRENQTPAANKSRKPRGKVQIKPSSWNVSVPEHMKPIFAQVPVYGQCSFHPARLCVLSAEPSHSSVSWRRLPLRSSSVKVHTTLLSSLWSTLLNHLILGAQSRVSCPCWQAFVPHLPPPRAPKHDTKPCRLLQKHTN